MDYDENFNVIQQAKDIDVVQEESKNIINKLKSIDKNKRLNVVPQQSATKSQQESPSPAINMSMDHGIDFNQLFDKIF